MSDKVSLRNAIINADGRTIIALIFSITFLIVSIYAMYKGYVKEVLSMLASYIGMILGYYYGAKTRERVRE